MPTFKVHTRDRGATGGRNRPNRDRALRTAFGAGSNTGLAAAWRERRRWARLWVRLTSLCVCDESREHEKFSPQSLGSLSIRLRLVVENAQSNLVRSRWLWPFQGGWHAKKAAGRHGSLGNREAAYREAPRRRFCFASALHTPLGHMPPNPAITHRWKFGGRLGEAFLRYTVTPLAARKTAV